MRIMIRCDVEGVTGVTTYEQAEGSEFGRRMLMNDLLACVGAVNEHGSHEIHVYDEHTDGRNVDLEQVPNNVAVICGKPCYRADWPGLDGSYDAMFMVGFHARARVAGALLPHSYMIDNRALRINGTVVGEIGMEAAVAGDFGVPLWLVTGDSAGMAEAAQMVPGVKAVTVKDALGEFEAVCYGPGETAERIRRGTAEVMAARPAVEPLKFGGPVTLEVEIDAGAYFDRVKAGYGGLFVTEDRLEVRGDTVAEVWARYFGIQKECAG